MNRILIWLASIFLTGAGSYFFKGCETDKEIGALTKTVKSLNDSISAQRHEIRLVRLDNSRLYQLDSANRFFISEKEKLLLEMRNLYRDANARMSDLNYRLTACEEWKEDAQDGIIVERDTVRVKKRFLRKGYKIIKN